MTWTIKLNAKVNLKRSNDGTASLTEAMINQEIQSRLKQAVFDAKFMSLNAFRLIDDFAKGRPSMLTTTHGQNDAEIKDALRKYFHLDPNANRYMEMVSKIAVVYHAITIGLNAPFDLFVFAKPRSTAGTMTHGYCMINTSANKGLSEFFANSDIAKSRDHLQRLAMNAANNPARLSDEIHLNYEWFKDPSITSAMIANTIVHEASHKWAYTTDVCYKSTTYSHLLTANDFAEVVTQGIQPHFEHFVQRTDKTKEIYPMVAPGKEKIKAYPMNKFAVVNETWIKNADSYAWTAQRLWKKMAV